jgi:putative AlgH/UPF0301 family transcriptional regulator
MYFPPTDRRGLVDAGSCLADEAATCRICLEEDTPDALTSPCACKGSQQYVHPECLARWRDVAPSVDGMWMCATCETLYTERQPLSVLSRLELCLFGVYSRHHAPVWVSWRGQAQLLVANQESESGQPAQIQSPLDGPGFWDSSVILLVQRGPASGGWSGLILNHPERMPLPDRIRTDVSEADAARELCRLPPHNLHSLRADRAPPSPCVGGPCEVDELFVLHNIESAAGSTCVCPGVYFGGRLTELAAAANARSTVGGSESGSQGHTTTARVRTLRGICYWGEMQLDYEIHAGCWRTVPASNEIVFGEDTVSWRKLARERDVALRA